MPTTAGKKSQRFDPYETTDRLAAARKRLTGGDAPIPVESTKAILEFVDAHERIVSPARRLLYLRQLTRDAEKLGTDFLSPNEGTEKKFRAAYAGSEGWTFKTAVAVATVFWKWRFAKSGKEFPGYLHIKIGKRELARKDPSDVIAPEEVRRLVSAATNNRDKALIATLYESGCRIGEMLSIRIRDCEQTDTRIRLHLDGKTGRRTVPLFEAAVPALGTWLRDHPRANDPDALVWVGTQATERLGEPITYAAVRKIITTAAKRAGIDRDIHAHLFRHSRASEIAKNGNVSTAIMESYFGWEHGSPMAATYVHLNGREVEEAMARAIGVQKPEEPKASPTLPQKCSRCSFLNDATAKFCTQCGAPLSAEALGRILEVEGNAKRLLAVEAKAKRLAELLRRPEVIEFLAKQLAATPT